MLSTQRYKWFPGLNALRFVAASLVVLMHTHLGMKQAGLPMLTEWPILLKGFAAVSFFFVLSGFLITYLLLGEMEKTGTVNVPKFYWRRVFRIWPLYFLVVAFGLLFYWEIVPALGLDFDIDYPKSLALVLYTAFAANLMNSLFHVGGMLHVTWSIAVEEQFYLFWAPLVSRFRKSMPWLIGIVTGLSFGVNALNTVNAFGLSIELQGFIATLQFHYMGVGAGAAWLLFHNSQKLLSLMIFRSKVLQSVLFAAIVGYYGFYEKNQLMEVLFPLPMAVLYAWLILNVAVNPKRILGFENKAADFLGSISYGIYMFHMPVVYAMSFFMKKAPESWLGGPAYFSAFFLLVALITIAIAWVSHRFVETPILEMGRKWMSRTKSVRLPGQKGVGLVS